MWMVNSALYLIDTEEKPGYGRLKCRIKYLHSTLIRYQFRMMLLGAKSYDTHI